MRQKAIWIPHRLLNTADKITPNTKNPARGRGFLCPIEIARSDYIELVFFRNTDRNAGYVAGEFRVVNILENFSNLSRLIDTNISGFIG